MDAIRDFAEDVAWVLDTCARQVASYPPALADAGLAYLERRRLLKEKSQRSGIVYLLPFWLAEEFGLSREQCRQLALADTFGLLYFFVQDEVMDAGAGEYRADLLPLGNLFFLDALAPYRSLFPPGSPFWDRMHDYVSEWAESVSWERREHWGRPRPFAAGDLQRLAGKAAPLKIPCAAVALTANRPEAAALLDELVDDLQVVFQLIDDLRDWREDLERGNYTYFLTCVAESLQPGGLLEPGTALDAAAIEAAPGLQDALKHVFGLAGEYNRRALARTRELALPYLAAYVEEQERLCRRLQKELSVG